jgi:hypothetical protein
VQVPQRCEDDVATDEGGRAGVCPVFGAAQRRDRGSPGDERDDDRQPEVPPRAMMGAVVEPARDDRDRDGPQACGREQGYWQACSAPLDQV